jgi:uncharacterized protein
MAHVESPTLLPVLHVQLLYCAGPGHADCSDLLLPAGATVADALQASGLTQRHSELSGVPTLRLGVWNKVREADALLRDGDRVEVYRALLVDPKEARRQRYQQHKQSLAARKPRPGPGPAKA